MDGGGGVNWMAHQVGYGFGNGGEEPRLNLGWHGDQPGIRGIANLRHA